MVKAAQVKELREKTGAGMMDCKKALNEAEGNMEKAMSYLKEKGLAQAEKKADREVNEGRIESYIHMGGKIGVLLEINCETDFVAKNDEFKSFSKDIAMHIAAMAPTYLSREDVPESIINSQEKVLRQQALNEGKPEHVLDKIVSGRMDKFFEENCLLEQPFVKDTDKTVEEVKKETIAKLGENISIRRFIRYQMGESLEPDHHSERVSEDQQNE